MFSGGRSRGISTAESAAAGTWRVALNRVRPMTHGQRLAGSGKWLERVILRANTEKIQRNGGKNRGKWL